jgi:hypothetical protein
MNAKAKGTRIEGRSIPLPEAVALSRHAINAINALIPLRNRWRDRQWLPDVRELPNKTKLAENVLRNAVSCALDASGRAFEAREVQ